MIAMARRRLGRSKLLTVGLVLSAIVALLAVLAPLVTEHDPARQNLLHFLKPPGHQIEGGARFLAGTDHLGRDLLSRILHGLRLSLVVAGIGTVISTVLGSLVGLLSGTLGGFWDSLVMRAVDFQLSIPFLLIAILWVALVGNTIRDLVIVVVIYGWVAFARVARDLASTLRQKEYVLAAAALGASRARVMFRHIAPQIVPQLIVVLSFTLGRAVILESSLGFLGMGLPPPTPTLGGLVGDGRAYITTAWWLATFPGLTILLVVLAASFAGDGLRDLLDPKLR